MPEKYMYQLYVTFPVALQLMVSGLIFFSPLVKKRLYPLRLVLAVVISLCLFFPGVVLRTEWNNLTTRFIMNFIQLSAPLIIVFFCYEGSISTKLEAWCAGAAAMELSTVASAFLLLAFGVDPRYSISFSGTEQVTGLDWALHYVLLIVGYCITYHLFGRGKAEELDRGSSRSTMVLTLLCMLFLIVPSCITNEYRYTSFPLFLVNRLYVLALALFILALCGSIEIQSRYRMDMAVMDQVLEEERKQYQRLKENMDVINMRCHDLKHQLEDFAGKLTSQEIESLRSAMDIYDSCIKTGSEVLDVVLYTSQLSCQKDDIKLTCLAEGGTLAFIQTRHLFSLFNNAIGNAMEAVRKLDEPDKRVVSVTVQRQSGSVNIAVMNYFDGKTAAPGETTKKDRSRHGFGVLSMQYITRLYSGTLLTRTQGELYCLDISIPIPEGAVN